MAQGQIPVIDKTPKTVYCANCSHFQRDTSGPSRRKSDDTYFMGICLEGLKPDTIKKQFADKPRYCKMFDKSDE